MENVGAAQVAGTARRERRSLDRGAVHRARISRRPLQAAAMIESVEDLAALARGCCGIARRAGSAIMRVYAGDFSVERKDDNSPLTEADLAAHRAIVDGLRLLTSQIPILSEESAEHAEWRTRQQWVRYWLVDPLDGTREFIKRNGEFTVNIALIEDHAPSLGVVFAPATNELYW